MLHPWQFSSSSLFNRLLSDKRFASLRPLFFVVAVTLLGVCAASSSAHAEISAPAAISDIYSDVNMRVQLATTKGVSKPCVAGECALNKEFDQHVQALGAQLSEVAFDAYPDLKKRIKHFDFVVVEKKEPGTISNAAGTIVIFRGVQGLELEEQALAFVVAREMGRVIAGYHDQNTGTSILLSVLATVLFPASGILQSINGSAAAANATSSATMALATAASSATSFVGSKMVLAGIKPKQLREADAIAMRLFEPLDWSKDELIGSLEACTHIDGEDAWQKDFRYSTAHVRTLVDDEEKMLASNDVKVQPLEHTTETDKPVLVLKEPVPKEPVIVAKHTPKVSRASEVAPLAIIAKEATDIEGVAKNEVNVSPDVAVMDDVTVPEVEAAEEQQTLAEVEVDEGLSEESQTPDIVSEQLVQAKRQAISKQAKVAKKSTPSRTLNKNAGKKISKVAAKATSKKSGTKLAKATASSKQKNTKKLYASKSSKANPSPSASSKAEKKTVSAKVKSISVKPAQVEAR